MISLFEIRGVYNGEEEENNNEHTRTIRAQRALNLECKQRATLASSTKFQCHCTG